jgi:hypothetical protein
MAGHSPDLSKMDENFARMVEFVREHMAGKQQAA